MTPPRQFPSLLASLLAGDPGRPLVTFYDDATGERVELSVVTWANWVAKAASLLTEECDLERGAVLRLDLPPHWLSTVFAAAAWSAGIAVAPTDLDHHLVEDPGAALPDVVVCGPDGLGRWAPHADDVVVLACALLPLGVRFTDPLPAGVLDVGVGIWSQPDAFVADEPPTPEDAAVVGHGPATTQGDLLAAASASALVADGDRVLTTHDLGGAPGLELLAAVLARRASLVLVTGLGAEGDARLDALAEAERATRRTA